MFINFFLFESKIEKNVHSVIPIQKKKIIYKNYWCNIKYIDVKETLWIFKDSILKGLIINTAKRILVRKAISHSYY